MNINDYSFETKSDEGKVIKTFSSVSHQRIQHYDDIINSMVLSELEKCKAKKFIPSDEQIKQFKNELIRHIIINKNIDAAAKLHIFKPTELLHG
jgi:hypothetical protein